MVIPGSSVDEYFCFSIMQCIHSQVPGGFCLMEWRNTPGKPGYVSEHSMSWRLVNNLLGNLLLTSRVLYSCLHVILFGKYSSWNVLIVTYSPSPNKQLKRTYFSILYRGPVILCQAPTSFHSLFLHDIGLFISELLRQHNMSLVFKM
jgi:hypothetical protein